MKKLLSKKENVFMFAYMEELEKELLNYREEINAVEFHDSEANVDTGLKIFLQEFILSKKNKLNNNIKNKSIVFNIPTEHKILFKYSDFSSYVIKNVLLPEDLQEEHIKSIKRENIVYTQPDLMLEISNGNSLFYKTIELKSTLSNNIPGSSIQQIKPYEWVIFVKQQNNTISITTGLYINSITSRLQFPDRSPRPQVGFNHLANWNNLNRINTGTEITYNFNYDEERDKLQILGDWQTFLAKRWVKVVFDNKIKPREPWFNNNLRKFILEFLNKYDNLSDYEKENFKKTNKNLIT